MIGQTLDGRYRIVSLLGEGGMGKVYLAEHVVLEKRMAIKVLHEEYSRNEELVKRFQQEAIAASRIGQENIVNVTDFGRTPEGALFFVMEEIPGESLSAVLRREGAIPTPRALPILAQVCRALAAAHSRGIVHRDLKPDNVILVQRDDRADFVKVLDFGISKVGASDSGKEKLTRVGMIMGTPEYMAPEQAAGTTVDHRVDIYSFGVMAYEVLTGALPFTAENPLTILMKHQTEPPPPPRARRPDLDIPESVERLILKAMAKNPAERQQYMGEVMNEINQALVGQGLGPITMPGVPQARAMTPAPSTRTPRGTLQLSPEEVSGIYSNPGAPSATGSVPPGVLQAPRPGSIPPGMVQRGGTMPPGTPTPVPRRTGVKVGVVVAVAAVLGGGAFVVAKTRSPAPVVAEAPKPSPVPVAPAPVPAPAPVAVSHTPVPAVPTPPPAPAAPSTVNLVLVSEPLGAQVLQDGHPVGVTPVTLHLTAGAISNYVFRHRGYRESVRSLAASETTVTVPLMKLPGRRKGGKHHAGENGTDDDLKADPFGG